MKNNAKWFILGGFVVMVALPIYNRILELLDLWFEVLKTKPAKRLLNYQKDVALTQEFTAPINPVSNIEVINIDEDDF